MNDINNVNIIFFRIAAKLHFINYNYPHFLLYLSQIELNCIITTYIIHTNIYHTFNILRYEFEGRLSLSLSTYSFRKWTLDSKQSSVPSREFTSNIFPRSPESIYHPSSTHFACISFIFNLSNLNFTLPSFFSFQRDQTFQHISKHRREGGREGISRSRIHGTASFLFFPLPLHARGIPLNVP